MLLQSPASPRMNTSSLGGAVAWIDSAVELGADIESRLQAFRNLSGLLNTHSLEPSLVLEPNLHFPMEEIFNLNPWSSLYKM